MPAGQAAAAAQQGPLGNGAEMQQQIEALRATVELAARQGSAQARIALEPEQLGAVRIHITQTAAGLIARVSADSVAGAQAIASGQGDLRGALSSLGVSLLRLDIGSSTQGGGQQAQSQQQAPAPTRRLAAVEAVEADELAATPAVAANDPSDSSEAASRMRTVDVLA